MRYFATRVWSSRAPAGPLLFQKQGNRREAVRLLEPGDRVIEFATLGEPAAEEDQGRILAMCEPTNIEVDATLFVDETEPERSFDEYDRYRWPYGLLNVAAWEAPEKPLVADLTSQKELVGSQLARAVTDKISQITDPALIEYIERMDWHPIALKAGNESSKYLSDAYVWCERYNAPEPNFERKGVKIDPASVAYLYIAPIHAKGCKEPIAFKIGWSGDAEDRVRSFNRHSLPSIGGLEYRKPTMIKLHSAVEARNLEQHLRKRFESNCKCAENGEVIVDVSFSELVMEAKRIQRHKDLTESI